MLGNTSGFAALVKKEAPHSVITHCFLHRHALTTKILAAILKEILSTTTEVIIFIRARSLNCCLPNRLCQDMGAEYEEQQNLYAFLAKLLLWTRKVEADIFVNFQIPEEVLYEDSQDKKYCQFL